MATSIIEVVAPYAAFKPSDAGAGALLDEIHAIIEAEYAVHPFSQTSITKDNAATVLRQYIAMSQAFPYLQVSAVPLYSWSGSRIFTDIEYCWDAGGCREGFHLQVNGEQYRYAKGYRKDVCCWNVHLLVRSSIPKLCLIS